MFKKKINIKTVQKMALRDFKIENVKENGGMYEVSFKFKAYDSKIRGGNKREIFDELVKFKLRDDYIREKEEEI